MLQVETRKPAERQYLTLKGVIDDAPQDNGGEQESGVKTHRASDADVETVGGFVFQRCGGGRRVIRKQRGTY